MTKMAAMPVYLLLRNQKADDLESWYADLVPYAFLGGCLPLTCGYIHFLNHEKEAILFIIINVWK